MRTPARRTSCAAVVGSLCLTARLPRRRDRPNREITCFVTASNFGALNCSDTMAARIASHDRLVIVCKPQIETSNVSTLLSTKTLYNDDVRRQQDERRSDVHKSKQIKTVKLAKNVKITQEHLSMRQPQAAPPTSYFSLGNPKKSFSAVLFIHTSDHLCYLRRK